MPKTTRPWVRFVLRVGGEDPAFERLVETMRFAGFISARKTPAADWDITFRARSSTAADAQVLRLRSYGIKATIITEADINAQEVL